MLICKLNGPCDLLEKLRADVELLEKQVTTYRFFNLVVTGYHILDWIKNNECIPTATREAVKNMYGNEYISVCRDVANASKHFKFRENYKNRKIKSAKSMQGPFGIGRFGKGVFSVGEEQITIECLNGCKHDALKFAKAVLQTWDDFFKEHNIKQSSPTPADQTPL